jgi:hypothetical protein
VSGGALNPIPGETIEGDRVGFQAYYRGRWDLYGADANQGEPVGVEEPPSEDIEREEFLPAVSIDIDPEKGKKVKRRKFFMEDAYGAAGVDNEGNFLSNIYLSFSDQYGDRRLSAIFSSIDTFSNFYIRYANMNKRMQWGSTLYDTRTFYRTGYDPLRDRFDSREQIYRYTGLTFDVVYPLSRYLRLEGSAGAFDRSANYPVGRTPDGQITYSRFDQQAPIVFGGITGDTVKWQYYGPHQGSRFEFRLNYAQDLDEGGTLTNGFVLDFRKYFALGKRSEFAIRLWGAYADGNQPNIYSVGGADTIRGFPVRSLSIDRLDLSFMRMGGIRGRFFLDVGMSCWTRDDVEVNYLGQPGCTFIGEKTITDPFTGAQVTVGEDGRLTDGVASYGFGISLRLFGMPMHWDFIKRWDFKETLGSTEVDFWIGTQF